MKESERIILNFWSAVTELKVFCENTEILQKVKDLSLEEEEQLLKCCDGAEAIKSAVQSASILNECTEKRIVNKQVVSSFVESREALQEFTGIYKSKRGN